jgi:hypothetical protein
MRRVQQGRRVLSACPHHCAHSEGIALQHTCLEATLLENKTIPAFSMVNPWSPGLLGGQRQWFPLRLSGGDPVLSGVKANRGGKPLMTIAEQLDLIRDPTRFTIPSKGRCPLFPGVF